MCYAPAEKPQFSVAVLVENGGSGGKRAAPIARQLLDLYLSAENLDAKRQDVEKKSSIDKPLLFLLLALFAVGLTALYSAGGEARFYQQLERGGGAILFMFTLSPTQSTLAASVCVIFFSCRVTGAFCRAWLGVKINNARRWLNIGFYVQPSEFMKVALPLGLAFLYARLSELRLWHHLAFLAATAFVGILVLLQPDLGTAVVVFMVGVATVFFCRYRLALDCRFFRVGCGVITVVLAFFPESLSKKTHHHDV